MLTLLTLFTLLTLITLFRYASSCNFVYSKLGLVKENHLHRGAFWTGLSECLLPPAEADELLVVLLQLPPVFGGEPVLLLARSCWGDPGRDLTESVERNLIIFRSLEFLRIMLMNSSLDSFPSASPSLRRKTASTWEVVRWGEDSIISILLINRPCSCPSPWTKVLNLAEWTTSTTIKDLAEG